MRIAGFAQNQDIGYYKNLAPGPGRRQRRSTNDYIEGQVDWKPNDKFEFWARTFFENWDGRGDAGSRTGYVSGSWDETNLTDPNAYVGGGLFVNPNYGFSAINGGNPSALAGKNPADPIVTSVSLLNPSIRDNPSNTNSNTFIDPIRGPVETRQLR